jgi:hypothetical protein
MDVAYRDKKLSVSLFSCAPLWERSCAPDEHVQQLKSDLYKYTNDLNFKNAKRMGNVLTAAFRFVTRNFKNANLFKPGF